MKFYSEKYFYLITISVLLSWFILDFISSSQCFNTYFLGFLHWDVCKNMSFLVNFLYVAFQTLVVLASAYLIILSTIFFNKKYK